MALAAPAHRIQSIHVGGMFGPSWSSLAGASHAHESTAFNAVPNTTRGRVNLSVLAARTAGGAPPSSTLSAPPTPIVTRPRRASVRSVPVSIRRAPPPPPSRAAATALVDDDPFADVHAPQDFIAQALPPPRAAARAAQVHAQQQQQQQHTIVTYTHPRQPAAYAYSAAAPLRAQRDDQRTAKLVASVLLSRASGRPMRRRLPTSPEDKIYVRSGLSRMVEVEC